VPTALTNRRLGPRKSALRAASLPDATARSHDSEGLTQESARRDGRGTITPTELREISISEFAAWLRTQTSPKTKR
jgi:hypothetical protein